jgi:8-oxo-dGTP diphosphatase
MAVRDGDGWVACACGNKHWGLNGAAGVLIIRGNQILLQHRAPWVHNGDTWGIPGGARDSHESTIEGAFREAVEETGIDTDLLTPLYTFIDDHGDWRYETVIARSMMNPTRFVGWILKRLSNCLCIPALETPGRN